MRASAGPGRPAANSEYVYHVIGYVGRTPDAHYASEGRTCGEGIWDFAVEQAAETIAPFLVKEASGSVYKPEPQQEAHFTFQQAYHLASVARYQDLERANELENAHKLYYFQKESRERILKLLGQTRSQGQQEQTSEAGESSAPSAAEELDFEGAEQGVSSLRWQKHLLKYVYFLANSRKLAVLFAKSGNPLLASLVDESAGRCAYCCEELNKQTLEELLDFLALESQHCYRDVYRLFVDAQYPAERLENYERFVAETQNSPLLRAITLITTSPATPLLVFQTSRYLSVEDGDVVNLQVWADAQKQIAKAPLQLLLKAGGRKVSFSAVLELTDFSKRRLRYSLDAFIADYVIVRRESAFYVLSKPAQKCETKDFCCAVEWLSFGLDEKP